MKSILKKVAGVAITAVLALGMFSCSNGSDDPVKETVATPAFSVASGEVESGTEVTIACATEGAKIYYTTDGNAPTASSTEYTSAISITAAVTIKAIAVKDGMNDSAVASASYTIKETVATPAFSVASGVVENGTEVTISCTTEGAKIYYTTDGSVPTAASTEYTTAISLADDITIKAIAVKDGMNDSAVASAIYTVILPVIVPECVKVTGGTVTGADYMPLFDPDPGVFIKGRTVTLSSFYIGKYEVTQAQYKSVMKGQKVTVDGIEYTLADSPSYCDGVNEEYKLDFGKDHANYPVENVRWFDAVYYCNALSAKENLDPCYTITVTTVEDGHINEAEVTYDKAKNGYRLPTAAEWEYAARGGDPTQPDWNYRFSGADIAEGSTWEYFNNNTNAGLDTVGWYCHNNISGITGDSRVTISADGKGTHEVGQKAANRLGIYDMSGNVSEWCYDLYDRESRGGITKGEFTDPDGPSSGDERVYRGGSWWGFARHATVACNFGTIPSQRGYQYGFRVVRNATAE